MKAVRMSALNIGRIYLPPFPKEYPWYLFLLEAELTPGTQ